MPSPPTPRGSVTPPDGAATAPPGDIDFAKRLDAAFETAGLSSAAMVEALRTEDHSITAATLSYWRSGKRRPGRRASIDTIRAMERILGVDSGELLALTTGGKERGAGSTYHPVDYGRDAYTARIIDLRTALGLPDGGATRILRAHDTLVLDERGIRRRRETRLLLQAREDGVTCTAIGQLDRRGNDGPGIVETHTLGRVGAVGVDRDLRMLLTRIDLPRPLRLLDTVDVELITHYPDGAASSHGHEQWTEFTMHEYVLNLHFHENKLPVHIEAFATPRAPVPTDVSRVRQPTLHGTFAQAVFLDLPPGAGGMQWYYEGEGPEWLINPEDGRLSGSDDARQAWRDFRSALEVPLPPRREPAPEHTGA